MDAYAASVVHRHVLLRRVRVVIEDIEHDTVARLDGDLQVVRLRVALVVLLRDDEHVRLVGELDVRQRRVEYLRLVYAGT